MSTPNLIAARLTSAGQLLVRSGIEIDRILGGMMEDGDTVSASLPASGLFLSRLVSVDPVRQQLVVSCSEEKKANSSVLAARSVVLRCNHRGARYAFTARAPREALHEQEPVIQLALPTEVLAFQAGRAPKQMRVPPLPELACQVRMGMLSFESTLVDLSLDGRGFLLHDGVVPLCAGTTLSGARIRRPGQPTLVLDIEVRHVLPAALNNGTRGTRIACRLLADPAELDQLTRHFIVEP